MAKIRTNVSLSFELTQRLKAYRGPNFSHKIEELLRFALNHEENTPPVEQRTAGAEPTPAQATQFEGRLAFENSLKPIEDRLIDLELWSKRVPDIGQLETLVDNIDDRLNTLEEFSLDDRLQEIEAAIERQSG